MLAGRLSSYTQEADLDGSGAIEKRYWHTCFEMTYLLWEQHLIISAAPSSPSPTGPTGAPRRLPQAVSQPAFGSVRESERAYTVLEMKKSVPYHLMIDQLSIVEMPNEWLHNPPNFLDFQPDLQDIRQQIIETTTETFSGVEWIFGYVDSTSVLRKGRHWINIESL